MYAPYSERFQFPEGSCSDIDFILRLFSYDTNVSKVRIELPRSVYHSTQIEALMRSKQDTEDKMMGTALPTWRGYDEFLESILAEAEWEFRRDTAEIARDKLDAMTNHRQRKMSRSDYCDFIRKWPHLELLGLDNPGYESTSLMRRGLLGPTHWVEQFCRRLNS